MSIDNPTRIRLRKNGPLRAEVHLPGSKSESNRALIMQALSRGAIKVEGLSEAEDTQTLERLLRERPAVMDVGHAGTAMRFLAAYLSFQPSDHELTGSARMCERPIGPLVDALRAMGADIHYLGREGYPPLLIFGKNAKFRDSEVELPGNVSSQYISALCMVAWQQPDGLRIRLRGPVQSRPYIEMTLEMLSRFGIQHEWVGDTISIRRQAVRGGVFAVEADWSAASYWFCFAALDGEAEIRLHGLRQDSLQGDSVVADKMAALGVRTEWQDGVLLLKGGGPVADSVEWDFVDCPDLAQGMVVAAAALGVKVRMTGLQSLRIKETDRIKALQLELGKFGVSLVEEGEVWHLEGEFQPIENEISTYQDHRMAMAFAPLAMVCPAVTILEPEVVGKSYPGFWNDLGELTVDM